MEPTPNTTSNTTQTPPQPVEAPVAPPPPTTPVVPPPMEVTPPTPDDKFGFLKSKKFIVGIVVALLVIIGGLVVLQMVSKKPTTTQVAANPVVATVGTKTIYKNDVVAMARQQYNQKNLTNKTLQSTLNSMIERDILDIEAQKLGIKITPLELNNEVATIRAQQSGPLTQATTDFARYTLLRNKIMEKQVKNVVTNTVGYWVAPPPAPQLPEYPKQRSDGAKAMALVATLLKNGSTATAAAKVVYANYPSIQPILMVNGYGYQDAQLLPAINNPITYTLTPDFAKEINNPELVTALTSAKPNEVKSVALADNAGVTILQIVSVNSNGFATYEEFLNARKKELVKIVNPL